MTELSEAVPKVVLVTNIPAPYRVPFWSLLASDRRIDLTVVFCAGKEPNRQWDLDEFKFKFVFLREAYSLKGSRYVHNNIDVMRTLGKLDPDIVITTGFNPTFLYAFLYAWWNRRAHICMTDGTFDSENKLSTTHQLIRALIFKRSAAFIGASDGSLKLYRSWNLPDARIFKSALCIDNERFSAVCGQSKRFDLMFCGRFAEEKNPLFAIDVAERTALKLGRTVSVLFVGSGELEAAMRVRAQNAKSIAVTFNGFAKQSELPNLYGQARVFLFPTQGDVWGIVASEACAAGLPVVTTPYAGVVGEIVVDGVNGFVAELDAELWSNKVLPLFTDESLYARFSESSLRLVTGHTHAAAAAGALDAILVALDSPR